MAVFASFPMAGFGVETEKVFSPLFSPLYFPTKYLAEKRIKIIEKIYIFPLNYHVKFNTAEKKKEQITIILLPLCLHPLPPFIKGKLSLAEYIPRLFLCTLFSFKRNSLKKNSLHFQRALHFTMYFYILCWIVCFFLLSSAMCF